jgi:predicted RNA binding protein YcfA (HicA-like mRNA interferase family)
MKWSELRKIAERMGWYLFRKGKKHDIYRHKDKDYTILIERHDSREIKQGLYYKLKKLIGF